MPPSGRALVPLTLSLTASCLFVPREAGERMQADLLALRGEVARLNQELTAERTERHVALEQTGNALSELRAHVDQSSQTARQGDADLESQLDHLLGDLQRLKGAIEDSDHRLSEAEGRLQAELAKRLAALKQASASDAAQARPATALRPRDRKQQLATARQLLKAGKKAEGRASLRDLVQRFGRETGVGDEALYLLASQAFDDGQMQVALPDWVRLVDGFAAGRFVAEGYFKLGVCSAALGNRQDATTFFTEVMAQHAGTTWAAKAKEQLALLKANKTVRAAASPREPSSPPAEPNGALKVPVPAGARGSNANHSDAGGRGAANESNRPL